MAGEFWMDPVDLEIRGRIFSRRDGTYIWERETRWRAGNAWAIAFRCSLDREIKMPQIAISSYNDLLENRNMSKISDVRRTVPILPGPARYRVSTSCWTSWWLRYGDSSLCPDKAMLNILLCPNELVTVVFRCMNASAPLCFHRQLSLNDLD